MDFSNRELATGILIASGVILVVVFSKGRRTMYALKTFFET